MRAGKIEGVTTPNQNQGTSPWYFCCIFISHFYRAYKYYFFSLKFSYEHSEIPTNFCFHDLLYFQNNECKKKTRNSRGKSRAMETHFYPIHFFFLSLVFSYEHEERFPTLFFVCPVSISRIMNAKKISKFEREVKSNGNTLLPHTFFFLSLDCSYEHSERFPTIFFHALLVFVLY